MRRNDREIKDISSVLKIIETCDVCRLAFSDGIYPYIIPMNFGFSFENGILNLFFHCANNGKKLDILRKNSNVCFEFDRQCKLIEGEKACDYSVESESVIGFGTAEIINKKSEKTNALLHLMKQYSPQNEFSIPENMLDKVTVFKVASTNFTGKKIN